MQLLNIYIKAGRGKKLRKDGSEKCIFSYLTFFFTGGFSSKAIATPMEKIFVCFFVCWV